MNQLSAFFLLFLISYSMNAHATSRTITIYGAANGCHLVEGKKNGDYILQIGAFRSYANAMAYKKRLVSKTSARIQVVAPQKNQTNFVVIAGPFKNSTAIKQLSQQLSAPAVQQIAARKPSPVLRKPPPRLASNKPVLANNHSVMDANTQDANTLAMAMQATGKVHVGSSRQQIEGKTAELQAELAAIQLKMQHETEPYALASLEKRQSIIKHELDTIMTMVIARISRR